MKVNQKIKLAQLEKKVVQLEENWKRALADYANLEKRVERQKQDLAFFLKGELLLNFLKVFEDLKRCQKALKNEGVDLILEKFERTLTNCGVKEIEAKGKIFDPESMEAVEKVKDGKKGRVSQVFESGYLLDDQVLKPAKVVVAD